VILEILLDLPMAPAFDYRWGVERGAPPLLGSVVLVPWGTGRRIGLVGGHKERSELPDERVRDVLEVLADLPTQDDSWWRLLRFAAQYYHRHLGELALPALPKTLRQPPKSRPKRRSRQATETEAADSLPGTVPPALPLLPTLSAQQALALERLIAAQGYVCHLLHGITGSGKTEVYLRWIAHHLKQPGAQVLLLVPEIALTPQLLSRLKARFSDTSMVVLHSLLSDNQRAEGWLEAARGQAQLVVGTRLAVLTPLPGLAAIVVDEEHDPSFKQPDAARYSARDLAVARASQAGIPIVLGSATPSLETWHAAQTGRYQRLDLLERAAGGQLPPIHLVNLGQTRPEHGLAPSSIATLQTTLAQGFQSLVFINRRGFAPVLHCSACAWVSRCDACSANRVLHRMPRGRYRLICHHCSATQAVPQRCPQCGNQDLSPLGAGTQQMEDILAQQVPGARVLRLDRDVARKKGATQAVLDAAHAGEADILVGTQMLAKGHDFQRLALVLVLDADNGLYSSDFRAPERLFATLMQVAGRAGRSAEVAAHARVLIQTRFVDHPLFAALQAHDYPRFAQDQLTEREAAGLPPFRYQAMLRVEARSFAQAHAWLSAARDQAQPWLARSGGAKRPNAVVLYDPVPMLMARVAHVERAQLLIESASRKFLHEFLTPWQAQLRTQKLSDGVLRWVLEIDPLEL
jgi:primosomal protein N' (replication factor Y) (superfamily II helicase)